MAKELPYFQFEPAEYLTKDISFCSLAAQGLFINICSLYWQRSCALNKTQILRRFSYENEFNELLSEGVIDLDGEDINIKFLDIQMSKVLETSKINSANGAKGGRPKKPIKTETKPNVNPNVNPNESETKGIREDKIRKEDIKVDDYTPPPSISKEVQQMAKDYLENQREQIELIQMNVLRQKNEKLFTDLLWCFCLEQIGKDKGHLSYADFKQHVWYWFNHASFNAEKKLQFLKVA